MQLLGAFTNQINIIKEGLVIEEMNKMTIRATNHIDMMDGSVKAKVAK